MTLDTIPPLIQAMLDPGQYRHPAHKIQLIQTHISYVILAGDFVYKIKKPLNFGFLDFSTLDKRKYYCDEELQLNRRLCPTIYQEVLAIHQQGEIYNLSGHGKIGEYCLKMVRMPQDKMMNKIITAGKMTRQNIDDIVAVLEPFYALAQGSPKIDEYGTAKTVGVNVMENFQQTEQFVGCKALTADEFQSIRSYAKSFLDKRKNIFAQRIAEDRIRECHGDLHSANICLADQVYIYDCIEFNKRFRYSDIACDLAFLAMDLEYNGLHKLSDYFIKRYIDDSGDSGLLKVFNFYKCYRASVRGKIGLLTAHEPEVDEKTRESSLNQAERYFLLAQKYADLCANATC